MQILSSEFVAHFPKWVSHCESVEDLIKMDNYPRFVTPTLKPLEIFERSEFDLFILETNGMPLPKKTGAIG